VTCSRVGVLMQLQTPTLSVELSSPRVKAKGF